MVNYKPLGRQVEILLALSISQQAKLDVNAILQALISLVWAFSRCSRILLLLEACCLCGIVLLSTSPHGEAAGWNSLGAYSMIYFVRTWHDYPSDFFFFLSLSMCILFVIAWEKRGMHKGWFVLLFGLGWGVAVKNFCPKMPSLLLSTAWELSYLKLFCDDINGMCFLVRSVIGITLVLSS